MNEKTPLTDEQIDNAPRTVDYDRNTGEVWSWQPPKPKHGIGTGAAPAETTKYPPGIQRLIDATPAEINRMQWRLVLAGLKRARDELDKTGVVHSWLYPYIQIAESESTAICRTDGRCQYAIDHGAEGLGHCPKGKCAMASESAPMAHHGNAEEMWIEHEKDACPHCGGSGHKDDVLSTAPAEAAPQPDRDPAASKSHDVARGAGNACARLSLVTALHSLASDFENSLYAFRDDAEALKKAKGDIAHARSVAARFNQNGPCCFDRDASGGAVEALRKELPLLRNLLLGGGDGSLARAMLCVRRLEAALAAQGDVKVQPVGVGVVTDVMVDAYLREQRRTVEEADRFGRPHAGGLHTNTVRAACRNGIAAALAAHEAAQQDAGDALTADPISDEAQAALYKMAEGTPYYNDLRKLYRLASAQRPAVESGPSDERAAFAQYINECDELATIPDAAGAFHWAWSNRALSAAPSEAVLRDAERYRWLRDKNTRMSYTSDTGPRPSSPEQRLLYAIEAARKKQVTDMIEIQLLCHHVAWGGEPIWKDGEHFDYAANMDAAIDAAIAASKESSA